MATTQVPNRWLDPGQAASGARYTGLAASITGRPWLPVIDPFEDIIARNRAREAEAARLAAMAAAANQRPFLPPLPGLGGGPMPTPPKPPEQPFEIGGVPLSGPLGTAAGAALSGVADATRAVGGWLTSEAPNPIQPGLDSAGNPLPPGGLTPSTNLPPMSYRVDSMGGQGPDREGYKQVPVIQGGEVIGYRYVADGTIPPAELKALEQKSLPGYTPGTGGGDLTQQAAEEASRNYPLPSQEDQIEQWFNSQQTQIAKVQEQVYGTPKMVNGELVFPYDKQKYLGITLEMQAQGLLPAPDIPNHPGPDATEAQLDSYRRQLQNSFRVPQYKVGDEWRYWLTADRASRVEFQKYARAAGAYEDNEFVSRGDIGESEQRIMTDWMTRANMMGVSWEDIARMDVKQRQAELAASRGGGGGGGGGGSPTRSVNIQYTQTSVAAARSLMEAVLADAIGRPPTRSELQGFLAMLNAAENKSPTRTVTNYVRGDNSTTATSRTTPSTVDPEAMARQYAQQINGGEEFADYQNNKYLTALIDMLRGAQNV